MQPLHEIGTVWCHTGAEDGPGCNDGESRGVLVLWGDVIVCAAEVVTKTVVLGRIAISRRSVESEEPAVRDDGIRDGDASEEDLQVLQVRDAVECTVGVECWDILASFTFRSPSFMAALSLDPQPHNLRRSSYYDLYSLRPHESSPFDMAAVIDPTGISSESPVKRCAIGPSLNPYMFINCYNQSLVNLSLILGTTG